MVFVKHEGKWELNGCFGVETPVRLVGKYCSLRQCSHCDWDDWRHMIMRETFCLQKGMWVIFDNERKI